MFDTATAIAPARLHLGFLDMNGGLGRRFGSLGLAIDGPATRLSIARAPSPGIEGVEGPRGASYLEILSGHLRLPHAYALTISEAIPAHAGLGSGTQLALAVAAALRCLEGLPPDPAGDAALLRRGERSGVGAAVFERGGFIVDGGHGEKTRTPPVIARLEFPPDWRIILVLDSRAKGVHGPQERAAFAQLGVFEGSAAAEICRLVLIKALPALAEKDIDAFGGAIGRIQDIVGDYFAPAQGGGRYASAAVADAMDALTRFGAKGAGQSSWGPTGFAFAESENDARRLGARLREKGVEPGIDIAICKGLNHGALVKGQSFDANS
ncbi:beta-ribofuranosylaminobenzene 5'-phosphate synthase family protein [Methylocapsa palsarum]|uniref:Beta-RFAP synthase n=1 Tax=Methylocapsa palsarum TaxID=1612308 RepID=A0A1I3VVJ7_9HYPH|nr:beta-ribofuranosylaminobenzene 5'-phosphate synthase family protein [Methylocapsa palsarum]SFJ98337.1 beta-RFAP synthase [Methylocapsa palsarum]